MTHAQKKSPPRQAAGIEGATTEEASNPIEQGQATAAPGIDTGHNCPAPELYPGRAHAIRKAKTALELHKAVARYAFAVMWARHSTGRGFDLAREVVVNVIASHASHSPVRPRLRKRFIAHVVTLVDEAARCAVEGDAA